MKRQWMILAACAAIGLVASAGFYQYQRERNAELLAARLKLKSEKPIKVELGSALRQPDLSGPDFHPETLKTKLQTTGTQKAMAQSAVRPGPMNDVGKKPAPLAPVKNSGEQRIPLTDARNALALVGTDPDAEAIWLTAINDPNMPSNARSDLIEDLNEVGFADPKNLTVEDLPVIENRIAIIETMAPDAMDQVNADAFQEAYKDLTNMHNRLSGI